MGRQLRKFRADKFDSETNGSLTHVASRLRPAVYMRLNAVPFASGNEYIRSELPILFVRVAGVSVAQPEH